MKAPRRAARPLSSLALWFLASSLATGCILSGNIDLPGAGDSDSDTANDSSGDIGLDSGGDLDGDAAGEPCDQGGAAGSAGAGGACTYR